MAHPIEGSAAIYKLPIVSAESLDPLFASMTKKSSAAKSAKAPSWRKGSNARFNYVVYAYVPPSLREAAQKEAEKIAEPHNHHQHSNGKDHKEHGDKFKDKSQLLKNLLTQLKPQSARNQPSEEPSRAASEAASKLREEDKPERTRITSSFETNPPNTPFFELRIGRGFSVPMFEKCVKTMKPGESARFLCMPEETEGIAALEQVLRQEKVNRERLEKGLAPLRTSGCCGQSAMILANNPDDAIRIQRDVLILAGGAAAVELEIFLLEVLEPDEFTREVWEMTVEEKLAESQSRRMQGKTLFQAGDIKGALEHYTRSVSLMESVSSSTSVTDARRENSFQKSEIEKEMRRRTAERKRLEQLGRNVPSELSEESVARYLNESTNALINTKVAGNLDLNVIDEELRTARLNYAACQLKLGEFPAVVAACTEVIKTDPDNEKALFRRSQAYRKIGRDLDLAQKDLDHLTTVFERQGVAKSQGEYKLLAKERLELDEKFKQFELKEKKMYSNMFS